MAVTGPAAELSALVGAAHVSADLAVLAEYVGALQGVAPELVISPGSVAELAQVARVLRAAGLGLVPYGGGTAQGQGAPPRPPICVVRTGRLCQVLQHEPGDLTISVEAGLTLGALAAVLGRSGLMLPVEAPLPERATVGGVLATAADGPRRLGYGTLRDLLIGVSVVEAGGQISKAGGLVVKNVSGFDMMKLHHGALGTLGVIASANFKLLPLQRKSATVRLRCGLDAALGLARGAQERRLMPTAAEYLQGLGVLDGLALRSEGLQRAVARHVGELVALGAEAGVPAEVLEGPAEEAFWSGVADAPQAAVLAPDEVVLLCGALPAALGAVLGTAVAGASRGGLGLGLCARVLSGVAYLRVRGLLGLRCAADGVAGLHRELREAHPGITLRLLGCGAGLRGVLRLPPYWPVAASTGRALMQRIKRELDPGDTLNPGRFIIENDSASCWAV